MLADTATSVIAVTSLSAALVYFALALTTLIHRKPFHHPAYVMALLLTAGWLVVAGWAGPASVGALCVEAASNLFWLWFIASLADRDTQSRGISAVGWIYVGLFTLQSIAVAALALPMLFGAPATIIASGFDTVQMLFAAGVLVLLHNLFDASRGEERQLLTWPLAALALLWGYALNIHAIAYLSSEPAALLQQLRPFIMALVAAMLAVAALRPGARAVHLSRPVVFRSLALAGVGGWLGLLSLLALLMPFAGQKFGGIAQIMVLAWTIVVAAMVFLSPRMRAYMRVWAAKHFYEHRYDYRVEWLRFTATLNHPELGGQSIDVRVVKAIADLVESPAGMLAAQSSGQTGVAAIWPTAALHPFAGDWSCLFDWMEQSLRIVQLDEVRNGFAPDGEAAAIPQWILADQQYWVAVPLVHLERIEAIVLLTRPLLDRALDWEDFDLLRVAGRQAASHIAEARGSEALAESERFDEFHRRFAFMMHDVKNLASQMALLSRNAERHGDKPDFREDMVATLRVCADRLNQLMQRLSQQEKVQVERLMEIDLALAARRIAESHRGQHQVKVIGLQSAKAWGTRETVEQLLIHLVQNAIDASPPDSPVRLRICQRGGQSLVMVEDTGSGMSHEFIRTQLFRPFHSTKAGGFGIGTYQARQLAEAIGGTLSVESREGEGTTFTLALASSARAATTQIQGEAA